MKLKYLAICSVACLSLFSSCSDVLDRPSETEYTDDNFWQNETQFRQYMNYYYSNYFTGYNSSYSEPYAPVRGYTFSDDYANAGKQSNFTQTVPGNNGSYTLLNAWAGAEYGGQAWNFSWVRKTNIVISRLESHKANFTEEEYNHWMGIARFFRAYEYARLVMTFGDVPFYDAPVNETDLASMYKDRDPRSVVDDAIYEDLKFALANVRANDGAMNVNKYVVAAVTSNIMLFEGTWQHYHLGNALEAKSKLSDENAKKYLQLCIDASEVVMNSGKYSCTSSFRSLFGSDDLSSNPEVIFYRHYESGLTTHCIGSYSNGEETLSSNANLQLLQSFVGTDGKPVAVDAANASTFSMSNLVKTRDSRLEATFLPVSWKHSSTYIYQDKFISREGASYYTDFSKRPSIYGSNVNINDAPCLRLGEVLLNWIEAKQVMAEFLGGSAVTQADIDKSINVLRDRPLDATAVANGVKKTEHLKLASIADDPTRDADVTPLMWEIRRERRMEFVFEGQRMGDIRRWFKLDYMNNETNPMTMLGAWVNFPVDAPEQLDIAHQNNLSVAIPTGNGFRYVTYNGTNAAEMIGFAVPTNAIKRNDFSNKNYLCPIGSDIISTYKNKGFSLTQTGGWE